MAVKSVSELVEEVREFLRIHVQSSELERFKDGGIRAVIAHVVGDDVDLQEKVRQGLIEHACDK